MKKLTGIILFLSLLFTMPAVGSAQFFFMGNPNVGKEAPEFKLPTTSNQVISLKDFRDGKKLIVFFWATWCPHCRKQLGELNNRLSDLEKQGIKLAPVNLGEPPEVVMNYVKKYNISTNIFLDIDSELSDSYGLIGVPTFFFIDENGIVKNVEHSLPDDLNKMF